MKIPCRVRAVSHFNTLALGVGLWAVASSVMAGSCVVSSSGMAFGSYQPLTFAGKVTSANVTSSAAVSVVCTGIVTSGSYSIALGPSTSGSSTNPRYLTNSVNGGANMVFNIYTEASYTSIWGDGISGSLVGGNIPSADSNQSHTVYGKIPAGQSTLKAGSFSDSLTITLTYSP